MAIASSSYKKALSAAIESLNPLRWLDHLPIAPLAIAAVLLGLSPPLAEPHLWQKFKLLVANELHQSIDIWDFLLHLSLIVVLALKLVRMNGLRRVKSR